MSVFAWLCVFMHYVCLGEVETVCVCMNICVGACIPLSPPSVTLLCSFTLFLLRVYSTYVSVCVGLFVCLCACECV